MKRTFHACFLAFFGFTLPLVAQTATNASAVGFPMGVRTEGSGIESVQVNNGNLNVTIPIWTQPGRGVTTSASFVYNNQGWYLVPVSCDSNGGSCIYNATAVPGNTMQMAIVLTGAGVQATGLTLGHTCGSNNHYGLNGFLVRETNGTAHSLVPNPVVTNTSGVDTSCWRANGGLLYASDGSGYTNVGSKTGGILGASDTNGNSIGTVDTLGRAITTDGSYHDSQGQLRKPTVTTQSVTIATHICNGVAPCNEATATWTVPHVITLPDGLTYTIEYVQNDEGEISSITLPTGAVVSYTYETASTEPHSGKRVIKRQVTIGSQVSSWTYSYTAATQAGYPSTTQVTAPDSSYVKYSCVPNYGLDYAPFDQAPGSYSVFACDISKTQYYSATGALIKTVDSGSNWPGLPHAVTTTWASTNQVVSTQYDYETMNVPLFPGGMIGPQSEPITWGNVSEKREYDYGVGGPGTLIRKTDYSYLHTDTTVNPNTNQAQYLALNIADRPTAEIVKDGSGNIVAETKYYYDEGMLTSTSAVPAVAHDYTHFGASNTIRGNLTRVSRWNNTYNTWLDTSYTYDDLGNLRSVTDPKGNKTTYDYTDAFYGASCNTTTMATYAFRTTTTTAAPFSFQSKNQYYGCSGLVESARDQNDLTAGRPGTTYSYDLMNRLVGTSLPDGGSTSINYGGTAQNNYQDPLPLTETTTTAMNAATNMVDATVMDAMGRPIHNQSSSSGGTTYVDTAYDLVGRVASVSNPHYSGSSNGTTSYAYDSLGRKTMQCQPDNGNNSPCVAGSSYLQWSYSGNVTTYSDELRNTWQRTTDGLGRLALVSEPGSLNTTYTYDALSNLHCVDQWGTAAAGTACQSSKDRYFVYDSLSRVVSASNLETGTVSYLYLSGTQQCSGEPSLPCSKTDARGVSTTYSYDALNRLTLKHYSDGTSNAAFGYDGKDSTGATLPASYRASSNEVGRLSYASNSVNADEGFGYDTTGRINSQTYCLPDNCANRQIVSAVYDLAGDMTYLTYPDGRQIKQTWNNAGQLGLPGQPAIQDTGSSQQYLQAVTYNSDKTPNLTTLGNGVVQTVTENNRLQVQSMTASSPLAPFNGQNFLANTYCYSSCTTGGIANNGNIWGITDTLKAANTQGFTYDSLNRIRSFSLGGAIGQQYSIDSFGNMSGMVNGAATTTFAAATNRISNLPCATSVSAYDAAGNQLCDIDPASQGIRQYQYDAESRISQITNLNAGAPYESYVYGADGSRVRKSNASGIYTEYVNFGGQTIAEKDQTGAWTDYIYANGERIAQIAPNDEAVHIHGVICSGCGSQAASWFTPLNNLNYVVKTGDKLSWRQYEASNVKGGMSLWFYEYGGTSSSTTDTDGQPLSQDGIQGAWHQRTLDLAPWIGQRIQTQAIGIWTTTGSGNADIWFADMALYSGDGTVVPIYHRQPSILLSFYGASSGLTTLSAAVDSTTVPVGSSSNQNTVAYSLSDHLGTAQLQFSGSGGWPVWRGQFAPFGAELDTQVTANSDHYKFTGKERDTESGLDYFGARYLSSNMGRWMSPDWSEQAEPVPYADLDFPQSLNLYSYVGNNPLASTDPDGHDFEYTSEQANLFKGGDASALSDTAAQESSLLHPHLCTPCHANGEPYSRATEKEKADAAAAAFAAYSAWKLSIILAKSALNINSGTDAASATGDKAKSGPKAADAPTITANGQAANSKGEKLGPSGNPQGNSTRHNTEKGAKEAASRESKDGTARKDANPKDGRGGHYHPNDTDRSASDHHYYPKN